MSNDQEPNLTQYEIEKGTISYEQSISAYQFQVSRYNTWMNLYALFVGALFVAFYGIAYNININDSANANDIENVCKCVCDSCSCTPAAESTIKPLAELFLPREYMLILVTLLGIIASGCWMASMMGNCAWINSYMRIIKRNEENLFASYPHTDPFDWFVHRYAITSKNEITQHPKFISTQKATQFFIGTTLTAWIFIFIWSICFVADKEMGCCGIIASLLVSTAISVATWRIFKLFS